MKILHTVESYLPARHGMQEVVTQLSEALVKMGHEVTIATSYDQRRKEQVINGVKIVDFKITGNFANGMEGDTLTYQNYLQASDFDVVTNFAAQQWATDLMLPILNLIKGKKIFVPTGFSGLHNPKYNRYFEQMRKWMKDYDANVFLSDNYQDINFARAAGVTAVEIIPNGASELEFERTKSIDIRDLLGIPKDSILLVSVGSHTGYKGHDKTIEIFKQAAIPNSALLIIGNITSGGGKIKNMMKGILNLLGLKRTNCSLSCKLAARSYNRSARNSSIHIREFPRNLTVNAYRQADLFILTSLIECSPIVLFEALAGKTPFAVNDVGNSREIIEWTKGGELLPSAFDKLGFSRVDVQAGALAIKRLVADREKLKKYADSGNDSFRNNFTWEKIAQRYEMLYIKTLKG